eukprot:TRINITY_DN769_c0_g1_i1.p1 TRINITY_DN769_c0_g1~~TRINITY_DN769_c0_g1_i1.p1  ORF type:complete len:214 (+),score=41.31 TRINITY_DN769_c0_g1_i1:48-644(+)
MSGLLLTLAMAVTPVVTWPPKFYANFTEETWFQGGYQRNPGWVAYDYEHTSEVIYRPNGELNPICNGVKKGYTGPCVHHSPNGNERYMIFPALKECCLECSRDCGTLTPKWVDAVPHVYLGLRQFDNVTCNEFVLESNTPDRVATSHSGTLCELYDGGAAFTGDNPFQWTIKQSTYTTTVPQSLLQLPSYCSPAKSCK